MSKIIKSKCGACGKSMQVQAYETDDGELVYGAPEGARTEHVTKVTDTGAKVCFDRARVARRRGK